MWVKHNERKRMDIENTFTTDEWRPKNINEYEVKNQKMVNGEVKKGRRFDI